MKTIQALLAEDENTLALILVDALGQRGITLRIASDGEAAWKAYCHERPDVMIVDVMMPRLDGFSLVQRIRREDADTPIIFLTARTHTDDVLRGFDVGADDYMRKPFSVRELEARIRVLARRSYCAEPLPTEAIELGKYVLRRNEQLLCYADAEPMQLSHRESELLWALASRSGTVVESQQLLLDLWGDDDMYNRRSLHVFISHLRDYLSRDTAVSILNVRGVGYKLLLPV